MSYAQAIMRYKGHNVTVKLIGNQIMIDATIYLARVWAKKQLHTVAKECKIDVIVANDKFFISPRNISKFKKKAIPKLQKFRK